MTVVKFRRTFLFTVICSVCLSSLSNAQLPQTRLYSLTPNGGQIGQEFEVRVLSGDDLDDVSQLVFSNPKITAKQKTTESNGKSTPVANTFVVNVPSDVPPGVYEVRCGGVFGFSNPRRFAIDHFAAAADPADNNTAEKAAPLALGQAVHGRLESGNDVDWFRISAKAGQRVILDTWAERLDSKMNPVIAVYDSTGRRRLDWSRNSIGYDPVLVFDVPADGDYCVLIRDITYRNGNEYSYRLHAHVNPHIEFVWPPAGKAGTKSQFTLFGYNLPDGKPSQLIHNDVTLESTTVEIDIPAQSDLLNVENRVRPTAAGTDAFSYRLTTDNAVSNPVRIGITPLDVIVEVEPNNTSEAAQTIRVPVEVGGQFGEPGDSDVFRFEAKKDEVYFVDVLAERLGAFSDPYLIINQITKQADGTEQIKRLTAQDDVATDLLVNIFETKTDDPVFRLQIPADGTYEVILRDRYWESRGNPLLRYSVAIRKETPDFRVVAIPSAPTPGTTWPTGLRKGDQFALSVIAFRQDGFNGAIEVSAENLPAGFSCTPVVIGPGETTSTLILGCQSDTPVGLHQIQLTSKAVLPGGDQPTVHSVRTGTVIWSTAANVPAISRITDSLTVSVMEEAAPFQISSELQRVKVNQGRQILLPVQIEKRVGFDEKVTLTAQGLPKNANIDFPNSAFEKGENSKTLRMFVKENSPPGFYTVWMNTQGQVAYRRNRAKADALKAESDAAKAKADEAKKAEQAATQKKTEATTALTQAQQALQQSQAATKSAETAVAESVKQQKAAQDAVTAANTKVEADKANVAKQTQAVATSENLLNTKKTELNATAKALEESQTQLTTAQAALTEAEKQVAELTKQSTEQPENEELKKQLEQANKSEADAKATVDSATKVVAQNVEANKTKTTEVATAAQQLETAKQQQAAAEKALVASTATLTDTQNKLKQATEQITKSEAALTAAKTATTQAEANVKTAEKNKADAEAAEKAAQALAKSTEAIRVSAEKASADAAKASAPKNINFTPPTTPIVVEVVPAPAKVAATVPNGGKVKKGENLEVTLKVTRQNNFAGPVQLTLALPAGVNGIQAAAVDVPADQAEGKLVIQTSGEATQGKIENVVVRVGADFQGPAEVDAPITLEVTE